MKKLLPWIICLLVIFYIGQDAGQPISGIRGEIGEKAWLAVDIRSYLLSWKYDNGFNPDSVLYSVEMGYEWLEYTHNCYHYIDRYDKGWTENKIGVVYKW